MPETRYIEVYRDGVLISSTPYEVSDADLEFEQAPAVLRGAIARLNQIITLGDEIANQGTNVTQAQIKGLFGAVADMARYQRRLIKFLARQLLNEDFEG